MRDPYGSIKDKYVLKIYEAPSMWISNFDTWNCNGQAGVLQLQGPARIPELMTQDTSSVLWL